jgi:hypothetical protein
MNNFMFIELLSKPMSMIRIYARYSYGLVSYNMHEDDTRV